MKPCLQARHAWGPRSHEADAVIYLDREGTLQGYGLCYRHLNEWLDAADDGMAVEPTELYFERANA